MQLVSPFPMHLNGVPVQVSLALLFLKEGICKRLTLADINPGAIACIKKTLHENGLRDKVEVYESDNLKGLPKSSKFDLVVGNPPNIYAVHPSLEESPTNLLKTCDPGWKINRDFFTNVPKYLKITPCYVSTK